MLSIWEEGCGCSVLAAVIEEDYSGSSFCNSRVRALTSEEGEGILQVLGSCERPDCRTMFHPDLIILAGK